MTGVDAVQVLHALNARLMEGGQAIPNPGATGAIATTVRRVGCPHPTVRADASNHRKKSAALAANGPSGFSPRPAVVGGHHRERVCKRAQRGDHSEFDLMPLPVRAGCRSVASVHEENSVTVGERAMALLGPRRDAVDPRDARTHGGAAHRVGWGCGDR